MYTDWASDTCTFNNCKKVLFPLGATLTPPVITNCRTQVKWMNSNCPIAGTPQKATEYDYLGFLYAINVANASEATTLSDFAQIKIMTCTGLSTGRCGGSDQVHWSDLLGAALLRYSGYLSNPHYTRFRDSGIGCGIDH